mgnify:CR=1 FL=1
MILQKATYAAVGGFFINLPFAIMEMMTQNPALPHSTFPVSLFIYMWIAAGAFVFIALLLIRERKEGKLLTAPFKLAVKIAVLFVIAWSWTTLVNDQWPCFLGATGC